MRDSHKCFLHVRLGANQDSSLKQMTTTSELFQWPIATPQRGWRLASNEWMDCRGGREGSPTGGDGKFLNSNGLKVRPYDLGHEGGGNCLRGIDVDP